MISSNGKKRSVFEENPAKRSTELERPQVASGV
jgi:hypothetical protein